MLSLKANGAEMINEARYHSLHEKKRNTGLTSTEVEELRQFDVVAHEKLKGFLKEFKDLCIKHQIQMVGTQPANPGEYAGHVVIVGNYMPYSVELKGSNSHTHDAFVRSIVEAQARLEEKPI